jgi:hypothetical protein
MKISQLEKRITGARPAVPLKFLAMRKREKEITDQTALESIIQRA